MNLLYITASYPYNTGESFLEEEIKNLASQGVDLLVVPRDCHGNPRDSFYKLQQCNHISLSNEKLFSINILISFFLGFIDNPLKISSWILKILTSGKIVKNMAVIPKAVWLATKIKRKSIQYVMVHWGGTTSTMAMIAADLSGVPWCMTCHRWDIYENNLLALKSKKSKFIRFISQKGREDALKIGAIPLKSHVIHMGVTVQNTIKPHEIAEQTVKILCPANLIEVKGHKYLLDAISKFVNNGSKNIKLFLYGDGHLKEELQKQVTELKIENFVEFGGQVKHEKIMSKLQSGFFDIMVLPSVFLKEGVHEGIPVSLMEAMSFGVPVLSTKTGSIPELIGDGSGIMVEDKNSDEIANALTRLINDKKLYRQTAEKGLEKVSNHFNIAMNVEKIIMLLKKNE